MQIEKNTVVQFHYTLTNENNEPVEDSRDGSSDPVAFLQGHGNIISGLEKAMEGKSAGDKFEVTIPPEDGYGKRVENSQQRLPIKHILGKDAKKLKNQLRPGMVVEVQTEHGPRHVTLLKVGKFSADVDTNHPFAGKTLTFAVDIIDVRAATEEEISHGHAHGVGGHHH